MQLLARGENGVSWFCLVEMVELKSAGDLRSSARGPLIFSHDLVEKRQWTLNDFQGDSTSKTGASLNRETNHHGRIRFLGQGHEDEIIRNDRIQFSS